MQDYKFRKAVPVWAEGREKEMNVWLAFTAKVYGGKSTVLAVTGSSAYSVRINGEFFAFGPARCAHGFYRVDELDITDALSVGENEVTITVAGYNCNGFYHIDQPSFFCAELISGGEVIAASGYEGFSCREVSEHEQKAERYSYQRTFVEIYNIGAEEKPAPKIVRTEEKKFIRRDCSYTHYDRIPAENIAFRGTFKVGDHKSVLRYPRQIGYPYFSYKIYPLSEVRTDLHLLARNIDTQSISPCKENPEGATINSGEFAIYHMSPEISGMFSLDVTADEDTEILLMFDEVMRDGNRLDYRRFGATGALLWRLPAGSHSLESFEPYSASYTGLYVLRGSVTVNNMKMIYFGAYKPGVRLKNADADLEKIFNAAVETYRQNTFTLYMDCPSRERAGWLCDSFFTGRVEKALTGKSEIEHNFLENFLLPESFDCIPDGMLPMCYPADHYNGTFIPNWAMFYVIELEEYLGRTGDRGLVDLAKDKISALMRWFEKYENEYSLLEDLDGWVFVEWSKSNELIKNVNFPTNMLYAMMLRSVCRLYGDRSAGEKADKIEKAINELSPIGIFYCDNALRGDDGQLHLSGKITETCQYYAFFCGTATPEENPELWKALLYDFGPQRVPRDKWPNLRPDAKHKNVYPSNAFIGDYLRLELLFRYGEHEKLIENIKGYFLDMARTTGTLWESESAAGSCNHGFASHVIYWLDKIGLTE